MMPFGAGISCVASSLGVLLGNIVLLFVPLLFGPFCPLACVVLPASLLITDVLMIPWVGAMTFLGGLWDLAAGGLGGLAAGK